MISLDPAPNISISRGVVSEKEVQKEVKGNEKNILDVECGYDRESGGSGAESEESFDGCQRSFVDPKLKSIGQRQFIGDDKRIGAFGGYEH